VVVEGAGGLLSPLGEGFDSRDLIQALNATPIIVCANKLGAVNQVRLVLEALPPAAKRLARVVLVNPKKPDAASRTNLELLKEYIKAERLRVMPWVGRGGKGPTSKHQHPEKLQAPSSNSPRSPKRGASSV